MYSNNSLLEKAIDITKEYAKSSNSANIDLVLGQIYEKLKQLNRDQDSE